MEEDAAALVATRVLSVSMGDAMTVIEGTLNELGAADETGTSYVDDDGVAALVATGVLSELTEGVPEDPAELDSTSGVLDGADSLEVLEGGDVFTGEVRTTEDCGDDGVLWLSVTIDAVDGDELFSETVLAAAVLLPNVAVDGAADGAAVDTAGA